MSDSDAAVVMSDADSGVVMMMLTLVM